jgi:hypothetical protein
VPDLADVVKDETVVERQDLPMSIMSTQKAAGDQQSADVVRLNG